MCSAHSALDQSWLWPSFTRRSHARQLLEPILDHSHPSSRILHVWEVTEMLEDMQAPSGASSRRGDGLFDGHGEVVGAVDDHHGTGDPVEHSGNRSDASRGENVLLPT